MPRLRTPSSPPLKRAPRKGKPAIRPLRTQGWRTTDEEEVERRRQRALTEPLRVDPLKPEHGAFGTFRVGSETGGSYEVEIRSLSRRDNSCGCPDYRVNGLGTCKHIEAVLARGRSRKAARADSGRIEVFLRRDGERPEVRAQWPAGARPSAAGALVERFFSRSGALRGDPLTLLPELARALASAPPRARGRVRLSRHLLPWVEEESRRAARRTARERFLEEVRAGRATLDVVKVPLYPYQREGMLHLAFTERALLADEMGRGKTVQAIAACALLRRLRGIERVLVISPASLKGEWEEQIARFTDLPARIIYGPRAQRLRQYGAGSFFYLMNYEQVRYDGEDIASGVVRFAPESRRSLHRSPALGAEKDPERDRRLAAARELQTQSERKIRMASVLAGGGFPVEALPSLREGVEIGLRAWALMAGTDLPESEKISEAWVEAHLAAHLPLVRTLRDGAETLLAATEGDVRAWITAGETLARGVGEELRRAG